MVVPGTELIFFVVSHMGQCFGFLLKMVWITQGCFAIAEQGIHRVRDFSVLHPTSE